MYTYVYKVKLSTYVKSEAQQLSMIYVLGLGKVRSSSTEGLGNMV